MKTTITITEIEDAIKHILGDIFKIIYESVDSYRFELNAQQRIYVGSLHKAITRNYEIIARLIDRFGEDHTKDQYMMCSNQGWRLIVKTVFGDVKKSFAIKFNKLDEDEDGNLHSATRNHTVQTELFAKQESTIGFPITDVNLQAGYVEEEDLTIHTYIVCSNGYDSNFGIIEGHNYFNYFAETMPTAKPETKKQAEVTSTRVYKKVEHNKPGNDNPDDSKK